MPPQAPGGLGLVLEIGPNGAYLCPYGHRLAVECPMNQYQAKTPQWQERDCIIAEQRMILSLFPCFLHFGICGEETGWYKEKEGW